MGANLCSYMLREEDTNSSSEGVFWCWVTSFAPKDGTIVKVELMHLLFIFIYLNFIFLNKNDVGLEYNPCKKYSNIMLF